jgi:pimeloyl-ACP methyl ester carboxylesterase
LHHAGLATLLLNLLTPEEQAIDAVDARFRFDIPLLARRLIGSTDWARRQAETRELPIGYFGASTGAAAALVAAAERADVVDAVVSRGGRPDLAEQLVRQVRTPTLLIVGGSDAEILRLNRLALEELGGPKALSIVPNATHLFEEPGALEQVACLARDWLKMHLGRPSGREGFFRAPSRGRSP